MTTSPDIAADTSGPAMVPAAERGQLSVQPRAVEKIAIHAAATVDTVGGTARRLLGVTIGSDQTDAKPRVEVDLNGMVGTARVRLSLSYPTPIRGACQQVRAAIREQVTQMTGVDLAQIDVHVTSLHRPTSPRTGPQ